MTRTVQEIEAVQELVAKGVNDCEISRRTGIPRTTVRDWRRGAPPSRRHMHGCCRCVGLDPSPPGASYAYLLGLYLGDGCISEHPRMFKLRIVLDAKYPGIIAECVSAIEALRPGRPVWQGRRRTCACVEVSNGWQHWPCLLPQHGPGRKHLRPIRLEPWQSEIVAGAHELFLRGLIHSDGCRIVANDRGRLTARYHFANRSEDIKHLFCASLDALGVHWTRPCDKQIAIYRKDDVAFLDRFIGPKS